MSFRCALLIVASLLTAGANAQTVSTPVASRAQPAHHASWTYEGEHGPTHWGRLDPAYAPCDNGKAQSPIDIAKVEADAAKSLKLDYKTSSLRIAHVEHVNELLDNGHTIQVTVDAGSTLTTSRNTYQLKQFHFHTPSEHTVDGKSFPMEMHFVHQSTDGQFAVVGLLFAEGPANENLAKLIANFPKAKGESANLPSEKLDLALQLPANKSIYSYLGSFTTPPCTEGVEWLVFRDPVQASRQQLEAFAARLNPNNRPIQPLNGRVIENATVSSSTAP